MSFVKQIPGIFSNETEIVLFSSAEEKNQIIESIADRIASVYAAFLTANCHAKRNEMKNLIFFNFPTTFPLNEEVERFKAKLKTGIIKELNKGDEDFDSICLSTNYSPEGLLRAVLGECGIVDINRLFPEKTSTRVISYNKLQKIEILMTHSSFTS